MATSAPEPAGRRKVSIRKIERDDLDRVVELLTRAFDDDPVANFFAKQDARRVERIGRSMRMNLEQLTFPFGETYVSEGFEGAALWNAPNQRPHGLWNDLRLIPGLFAMTGAARFPAVMSAVSRVEKLHPKEPHYYLFVIGVDPAYQGQGISRQLVAPVLERCDREGMPAYLESSKESNIPIYERFGFRVTGEIPLTKGGPMLWPMWRDPQ
jgi:ribosomal protein S18 acetylase RimI-like enzyme